VVCFFFRFLGLAALLFAMVAFDLKEMG
jgi:hypothetical protein